MGTGAPGPSFFESFCRKSLRIITFYGRNSNSMRMHLVEFDSCFAFSQNSNATEGERETETNCQCLKHATVPSHYRMLSCQYWIEICRQAIGRSLTEIREIDSVQETVTKMTSTDLSDDRQLCCLFT